MASKLERVRRTARELRGRLTESTTNAPFLGAAGGAACAAFDNQLDWSMDIGGFEVKPSTAFAAGATLFALQRRDPMAASVAAGALGAVTYNLIAD